MSSETDHPRQRTVAELLAAHGDANATGRRRRRREADEDEGAAPGYGGPAAEPPDWGSAPPREPDRPPARDGTPPSQRESAPRRRADNGRAAWDSEPPAVDRRDEDPWGSAPWASAQQDPAQRESGRRDPAQWDAEQWDADPWDADPRERAGWDAPPAQPSWDTRESRHPGPPPPRERPQRREPEEWEPARSRDREPRGGEARARAEAPSWESPEPEPARNGRQRRFRDAAAWGQPEPEAPPRRAAEAAPPNRAPSPPPDLATEQMPWVGQSGASDPARTTRIQQRRRPEPEADAPERGEDDGGPATMVGGAPAGAEAWHRARTDGRRRPDADVPGPGEDDDGPATMVGGAPAGAEAWHRARTDRRRRPDADVPGPGEDDGGPAMLAGGAPAGAEAWQQARTGGRRGPADGGPPTQAAAPLAFDDEDDYDGPAGDHPAGLGGRSVDDEPTGFFAPEPEPEAKKKGRFARGSDGGEPSTPTWAAVIAQWIAGAIGGAALWVGFRFLWRDLPVVALAAAVLVTVGLVVVVRALLRSSDLRTTLFAVLVGLLLTVSPAILVLLGR